MMQRHLILACTIVLLCIFGAVVDFFVFSLFATFVFTFASATSHSYAISFDFML